MSNLIIQSITNSSPTKVVDNNTLTVKKRQQSEVVLKPRDKEKKIQLDEQIRHLNQKLSGENKRIEYSVHERTNTLVFKIIDKNTGDLIKEVPSVKMLDMSADILEQFGLVIDKKV